MKLVKLLQRFKHEIISVSSPQKVLEEAGITITDISSLMGNPEAFSGRMKMISFNIESELLLEHGDLRFIEFPPQKCTSLFEMKKLSGAILIEDSDNKL